MIGFVLMIAGLIIVFSSVFVDWDGAIYVGIAVTLGGLLALMLDVNRRDELFAAKCYAAGGYVERGRNIALCIDRDKGIIIPIRVKFLVER